MFRFVRRDELDHLCFPNAPLATAAFPTAWPELDSCGSDVILLTKTYIASAELSQVPVVLCPGAFLARLDISVLKPAPLVELSARQKMELSKSAEFYEAAPRGLAKAAAYMRSFIYMSEV